jgi:hypothetical protein
VPSSGQTDVPQEEEVLISYVRSKDGKTKTIPVWFTVNDGKLELMPMYGLKTKWFAAVQRSGTLDLKIGRWEKNGSSARVLREARAIEEIKNRFSVKYGEGQVKRYYPNQDVALEIPI